MISGDFNGDGLTDIAEYGFSNWNMIVIYFSNGDGSFTGTYQGLPNDPNNLS